MHFLHNILYDLLIHAELTLVDISIDDVKLNLYKASLSVAAPMAIQCSYCLACVTVLV